MVRFRFVSAAIHKWKLGPLNFSRLIHVELKHRASFGLGEKRRNWRTRIYKNWHIVNKRGLVQYCIFMNALSNGEKSKLIKATV